MLLANERLPAFIDNDDLLDITLHKYQEQALYSEKRITCLVSGIQGGKTRIGGLWMARRIAQFDQPKKTFIIAFPTYKLGEKSTIPWMLNLLKGCGHFDKLHYRFYLNGGATLWFASMQDSDSVEGATNVAGVWIDEAGKIRYSAWINLFARSSFTQAPVFITTTPYSLNWLYKDIYMPWLKKQRDDIEFVQFKSSDNPYFPLSEFNLQKKLLDPRIFAMKYEGTFQRMAGLVFPEFSEDNYIENHLPSHHFFDYYCGIDIGFANPTAIIIRAIKLDGTQDIQVAEFYRSFLNPVERTEVLKQLHQVYHFKAGWCDSANPSDIALFVSAGLPISAVNKGPGSVEFGIQLHQEIIKTKIYRIIAEKNPNTIDEYNTYHYSETDDDKEHSVKEEPIKIKDHCMDANRYLTMMTVNLRNKASEQFKPVKTHLQLLLAGEYKKKEDSEWYNN